MIVFVVTWYVEDDPPHMRVFDLEENAVAFAQKIASFRRQVRVTRCKVRSEAFE